MRCYLLYYISNTRCLSRKSNRLTNNILVYSIGVQDLSWTSKIKFIPKKVNLIDDENTYQMGRKCLPDRGSG